MKIKRAYSAQLEVPPLYEDAYYRKKVIESKNEEFGSSTKEKLLTRHNSVSERIQHILEGKLHRLEEHDERVRTDQERYE